MPRRNRIVVAGLPHHITHRGNRRNRIFLKPDDYRIYLRLLKKYADKCAVQIWTYSLMPNHVHIIAVPEYKDSLAEAFGMADGTYAELFNGMYSTVGHVWQDRFSSYVMDENHLWNAIRYVERNPVRAGLVLRAEDYPWSSAAPHCGLRPDSLLSDDCPLLRVVENWSGWLAGEQSEESIREVRRHTDSGHPCGSMDFVRGILLPRKQG